ncbi:unnamed protein product [Prunus armeniaca]
MRFGKRGKLSPRYIGPYEITERIGPVAYRLALPPELSLVHDVFHVSMLRKYMPDPSHVLGHQPMELQEDLSYEEQPMQILDRKEEMLHSRSIHVVKVLWRSQTVEEATWELEAQMRVNYPYLFHSQFCFWELTSNFPVGHSSWDCSSPNSLNFGVPSTPKPVSSQKALC